MKGKKENDNIKTILIAVILILIIVIVYLAVNVIKARQEMNIIDEGMKNMDVEKLTDNSSSIDLSKGIDTDKTYSNPSDTISSNYGLTPVIKEQTKVYLQVDWSKYNNVVSLAGINSNEAIKTNKEELFVAEFQTPVKKVFIGEIGQNLVGTTVIFLFEDKTLAYARLFVNEDGAYKENYVYTNNESLKFNKVERLQNVSDVVNLYNAQTDSASTTLAAKEDGSFYDIGLMINQ